MNPKSKSIEVYEWSELKEWIKDNIIDMEEVIWLFTPWEGHIDPIIVQYDLDKLEDEYIYDKEFDNVDVIREHSIINDIIYQLRELANNNIIYIRF